MARPTSTADQARGTRSLPLSVSTSTSTTSAVKLKMPICWNGSPVATARFGSTVFWSKTQLWLPMIGPPAAQCARPLIAAKGSSRPGTPFRPTRPPARSSRSSTAHSSISLACCLSFFSTSAAACTTERPAT